MLEAWRIKLSAKHTAIRSSRHSSNVFSLGLYTDDERRWETSSQIWWIASVIYSDIQYSSSSTLARSWLDVAPISSLFVNLDRICMQNNLIMVSSHAWYIRIRTESTVTAAAAWLAHARNLLKDVSDFVSWRRLSLQSITPKAICNDWFQTK